jgi:pimeloyl-ACP methyl ester carboxylesterase
MTQRRQDYIETIRHRFIDLDGIRVFLREAGQSTAPAVLLPHGYPCSSYEFRNFMALLADRWHLIAPDFPGCGYSDTPENFAYDFDGYADFLERLIVRLNVERFALYLHDFGSQVGLRLAIKSPEAHCGFDHPERRHLRRPTRSKVYAAPSVLPQSDA